MGIFPPLTTSIKVKKLYGVGGKGEEAAWSQGES